MSLASGKCLRKSACPPCRKNSWIVSGEADTTDRSLCIEWGLRLLISQGCHRVDGCRAAGGTPCGGEARYAQQRGHREEAYGIARAQPWDQKHRQWFHEEEGAEQAGCRADQDKFRGAGQHHERDVAPARAQRTPISRVLRLTEYTITPYRPMVASISPSTPMPPSSGAPTWLGRNARPILE